MASSDRNLLRKTWPKVREIVIKGSVFYQVDPRRHLNGKSIGGKREAFTSKKEAFARAHEIASETIMDGSIAANMDATLRVMALKGQSILQPFGKTIFDAVDHYHAFLVAEKAKEESQTISALVELWRVKKSQKKGNSVLRPATVADIWETSRILKKEFGSLKMLEVGKRHFEDYLEKLDVSQRRKYNLRSRFSQFFNWCIDEHAIPIANPLNKIKIQLPKKPIPILEPEKADKIMRLCQSKYPQLLVYHAISLFAGLRPSEAMLLEWKDIHLSEGELKVRAETSKTNSERNVIINQTLKSWLESYNGYRSGRILNTNNDRDHLERFRAELGYKIKKINEKGEKWPADIMRHSFATYWLKIYSHRYQLAEIMGNSPKVIKEHYNAIVFKKNAESYWSILP